MRGASWRPLVRRLLVAALVLVAEFAAFEWFLRWRGGSEAAPVFQQLFMPDDVIGYRLRPDQSVVYTTPEFSTAISTNAQGVRDANIGPKPRYSHCARLADPEPWITTTPGCGPSRAGR